jgi:hypothetical protein
MSKDQILGAIILIGSIAVLGVYAFLLYAGYYLLAYGIVIMVAVVAVMGLWLGLADRWQQLLLPNRISDELEKPADEASAETENKV